MVLERSTFWIDWRLLEEELGAGLDSGLVVELGDGVGMGSSSPP